MIHYPRYGAFVAVSVVLLSLATAPPAAAAAAAPAAYEYQGDPAHDGYFSQVVPPLRRAWVNTLGTPTSYPVIAGGRVFVTTPTIGGYGTRLIALSLSTGQQLWSTDLGGIYYWSGLAYDSGRVYALNYSGVLAAFNPATGASLWAEQMPDQYSFNSPPTAVGGNVYVSGSGLGGTVYAVSGNGGAILWSKTVNGGDSSSPAVVSGVVYVSYACQQTYAFDAANGDLLWHYDNGCAGGGGSTPAVHGNSVYVRDVDTGNVILDKATGQLTGTFNAQPMPAFDSTHAYLVNGGALSARNLSIGTTAWSDDLGATSAPIVAGDWVYEGTSTGLVAVRAGSGATVWSASIPGGVPPPHEGGAGPPTTGLAAAAGYLIVPTATSIIAYHQRDFAVQAASPLRLPRGATAHSAVTIKSLFGFAGNVTLAVTGTSGGATASVAPRTVSVAPRQNGTARVIITAGRLATRFTLTVRACGPHFCRSSALKVQVG